jgi:hypothetical protein
MNKYLLSAIQVIFLFFAIGNESKAASHQTRLDSLLSVLDKTITDERIYVSERQAKIDKLKLELNNTPEKDTARFFLYEELFKKYEPFICDSALHYSQLILTEAETIKNNYWVNMGKIYRSRILASSGLFSESLNLLESTDKKMLNRKQLGVYFINYADLYIYMEEYTGGIQSGLYEPLVEAYLDSALTVLPEKSFEAVIAQVRKNIIENQLDDVDELLFDLQLRTDNYTREYAILKSWLAYYYELKHEAQLRREAYAESAIADIRASVKENVSLRNLAGLLLDDGGTQRANDYIKKSLEDANFFNARLRNLQVSRILPVIDITYQMERERQQKTLRRYSIIISVLSVILLIAIIRVFIQMRKLSKARNEVSKMNEKLQRKNASLAETNQIKEAYIGQFINLCSLYIDKMENYHHKLNKKARANNVEELYKMLKSSQFIEDELEEFYHNFDKAFLDIFPDFVEQFNALLPEEDRIILKKKDQLSNELRTFALIRLGINDSAQIAGFLRYSITTIYNYRSKYRNKSLVDRDEFENALMQIESKKTEI